MSKFETLQVHGGQVLDGSTNSRAVPIYQTTSYVFDSLEHAKDLFDLKREGNIYTRINNPTNDVLEKRMALLEKGVGALSLASGSAAITYSILNILKAGDEIVSANTLYGGTYNLFKHTLVKYGIKTNFVDPDNINNFSEAINENTKAIFIESIGNPNGNIIDILEVSKLASKHRIPLIVDNTFASPYLFNPIDYGANIVVHSLTKFIGGHGTTIGGIIIDGGNFDWEASGKFEDLVKGDSSYNNLSYTKEFSNLAYIVKARVSLLRDTGACLSPFNAFLLLQGLETLSLRMERHVYNTRKIVEYLNTNDRVSWINYAEDEKSKYKELQTKYFEKGVSSILTFGIAGGYDKAKLFVKNLKLFSLLANVADAKSLVIHPASTTHGQLSEEEKIKSKTYPEAIRISVGIENVDDLIADLEYAFSKLD